jgi:uridine kinase
MKMFFSKPLFWLGMLLRLVLIVAVMPSATLAWYAPFLDSSVISFSLDPWSDWLRHDGAPSAFPYGYAMWLVLLPATILCKALSIPITYGYAGTLLVADIAMLLQLRKQLQPRGDLLLVTYWLSPIVIVSTYFFGFNDVIPVLFLVAAFSTLRKMRLLWAGVLCTAAISAKLSMIVAIPFFLIYLLHNQRLKQFLQFYLKGLVLGGGILLMPFLVASSGGAYMLFNNPEIGKVYQLALDFGDDSKLYLVPLVYCLMIYATWRVRRLNFELFNATLGMSFLLLVIFTPVSPGWFVWAVPLLVSYQMQSDRFALVLVSLFTVTYLLCSLLANPQIFTVMDSLRYWLPALPRSLEKGTSSVLQTVLVALGIILAFRIWRETVIRNDFFRLSRKPFVLGIAGDSGAGKDTFSDAMRDLFGRHSVATISGDDYHLWDRQKPMWQVMTHLNPMANDLDGFAHDVVSLTDGKSIQSRHYDHATGKMSRPATIRSNDFIIASGLHALYSPIVRQCYNLKVYLDIDEDLRRFFKLRRDVHERGHAVEKVLASFTRREPDSEKFIRPQASYADLIFAVQPIHPRILADADNHPLRFKLLARSRHGYNAVFLTRILIGVCGLHVDMTESSDGTEVILTIEGEPTAEDIQLAVKIICPNLSEFLDIHPKWEEGVLGLMQLITLSHVNQALKKRFI